ncbi:MAG: alpha-amylase family protein, partial [Lentisphaeria bacterium]
MKKHFRLAALQCNFQTREKTLEMPDIWHKMGFNMEQLLHTHADLYSAIYDPNQHQKLMREYLKRSRDHHLSTIIYMNCHILGPALKEHFEDWSIKNEKGEKPLLYGTYPACCLNSGWREYFYKCIESLAEFDIEGIFFDGPQYNECWCPVCQARFEKETGHKMADACSKERHRYMMESVLAFKQELYQKVKSVNANWMMYFNEGLFSGSRNAVDMKRHLQCDDLIGTEGGFFFYMEPKTQSYWRCAVYAKMAEAVSDGKPTVIFFAGDHKPWGWYMHTPSETKLCYTSAIGNGASVWYGIHCNPENRNTETGKTAAKMVQFDKKYDDCYQNTQSLAEAAVFYSFDTASQYRKSGEASDLYSDAGRESNAPGDYAKSINGAFAMLEHLNIPYDIATDLDPDRILRYKILLVPCAAMLNLDVLKKMKRFVENGGLLIADGEFGFYDEKGARRTDGAADELTGGKVAGGLLNLQKFNYIGVESESLQFENAFGYLPAPGWAYPLRPTSKEGCVKVRCVEPMKGCYERKPGKPTIPIGTMRHFGKGSFLYIAAGFFEFYDGFEIGGYRNWMKSVIQNEAILSYSLENAMPGISMTVRKTKDDNVIIHLTNYIAAIRPISNVATISDLVLHAPEIWTCATDLQTGQKWTLFSAGVFDLLPLKEFCVIL